MSDPSLAFIHDTILLHDSSPEPSQAQTQWDKLIFDDADKKGRCNRMHEKEQQQKNRDRITSSNVQLMGYRRKRIYCY